MSAALQHDAPPRAMLPTRRRVWVAALLFGLGVHVLILVIGALLRVRSWEPLPQAIEIDAIEMFVADDEPGFGDDAPPGGGSEEAGDEEEASGEAEDKPVQPSAPKPPPTESEPVATAPEPSPEPQPGADLEVLEDIEAQQELVASFTSTETVVNRLRPAPKRQATIESKPRPANMDGSRTAYSRYNGQGRGRFGGPGGPGAGWGQGPRLVKEATPFGGRDGQFIGRVCFIPESTRFVKALRPCRTEVTLLTNSINVAPREFDQGFPGISERDEWFSISYSGNFQVKEKGIYEFRVVSDDGSFLRINGKPLVDNDGIHSAVGVSGRIHLDAGPHTFDLKYFQGPRYMVALQMFVTPPGGQERLFSPKF